MVLSMFKDLAHEGYPNATTSRFCEWSVADFANPVGFFQWCYCYARQFDLTIALNPEENGVCIEGAPYKSVTGFFQEIQRRLNRRLQQERCQTFLPRKPLCMNNDSCGQIYAHLHSEEDDQIFKEHWQWINQWKVSPKNSDQEIHRRNHAMVERLTARLIEFTDYEDVHITFVKNHWRPIAGLNIEFPIYVESGPSQIPHETGFLMYQSNEDEAEMVAMRDRFRAIKRKFEGQAR